MEDLGQPWMNDDRDYDDDVVVERDEEVEQEPIEVVQEELDDEYAREYFRKFEPDSDNDKNGLLALIFSWNEHSYFTFY